LEGHFGGVHNEGNQEQKSSKTAAAAVGKFLQKKEILENGSQRGWGRG
jgi:hypothetical protein